MIGRERTRHRLLVAVAAVAIGVLLALVWPRAEGPALTDAEGLTLTGAGNARAAATGDRLRVGDALATAHDGAAAVAWPDGTRIVLGAEAAVRFGTDEGDRGIALRVDGGEVAAGRPTVRDRHPARARDGARHALHG